MKLFNGIIKVERKNPRTHIHKHTHTHPLCSKENNLTLNDRALIRTLSDQEGGAIRAPLPSLSQRILQIET